MALHIEHRLPAALRGGLNPNHVAAFAIVIWTLGVVAAQSSGRVRLAGAIMLLVVPIIAFAALARPVLVILFIAATPLGAIEAGGASALIGLLLVTLLGQLLQRGWVSLGLRAGFIGFAGLVLAVFLFRAEITGEAALAARGFANGLIVLLLLGWISYNVTVSGDLTGRQLANALLVGLALTVVIELATSSNIYAVSSSGTQSLGRRVGYLAAMGFTISCARLLIPPPTERAPNRPLHIVLMLLFGVGMTAGLVRGAWLSAVVGVFFIALWAGKRRYWLLIPAALALILIVPVARERVVPSENIGPTLESSLVTYTTGRWRLWTTLWDEIESGLPFGHGFGHSFTLSSEQLFGLGSAHFVRDPSRRFVYAHNDFLFWMVELGIVGLIGMVLFWAQIVRAFRAVSRSGTQYASQVHILGGILITIFVAQMVSNVVTALPYAGRFLIVAGFVLGARQKIKLEAEARPWGSIDVP